MMMDDNQTLTLSLAVKLQNFLMLANQLISTVSILHIQNLLGIMGQSLCLWIWAKSDSRLNLPF